MPSRDEMRSRARELRRDMTDADRLLWAKLSRRQIAGYRFQRQRPVGNSIVDFICYQGRLVVEVDGSQHLMNSAYDAHRTAILEARGFRVLRFWNHDVLSKTEAVLDVIHKALTSTR